MATSLRLADRRNGHRRRRRVAHGFSPKIACRLRATKGVQITEIAPAGNDPPPPEIRGGNARAAVGRRPEIYRNLCVRVAAAFATLLLPRPRALSSTKPAKLTRIRYRARRGSGFSLQAGRARSRALGYSVDHHDNHADIAAADCARFGDRLGQFRDITKLQELIHSGATVAELTARPPRKRTRRARKRRLTLAAALDQARKAGHTVARYEEEPDGKIVVIPGKLGEQGTDDVKPNGNANPWDEVLSHAADKKRPS